MIQISRLKPVRHDWATELNWTDASHLLSLACLGLVHGDDPERCYGESGGRGVHVSERMYARGGFMSMYGKTNTVL